MDVEKILRKSAEEVRHVHSKYPLDTSQLEQRIYEKIHRGKRQRITRFVYATVSAVLVMVIALIVPVRIDPPQQKDSNQQASLQENYTIDVNQTYSYSDIKDSPIEQFILKKIQINKYNIKVFYQMTTKEGYWFLRLENPSLTDENGREFYGNHDSGRKGTDDALIFTPIGKYDSPPKKITLHFDGFKYQHAGSIGNFTVSLSETYPQNITVNEHTFTIEEVKYDDKNGELKVRITNFEKGIFKHLRFHTVRTDGTSANKMSGSDQYYTYSTSVPKTDGIYTIKVLSWNLTFQNKTAIEVDLSYE